MNLSNYEPALASKFCSLLHEGMTVIDVGAHVGIYSLIASDAVGRNGKVISIEASPTTAGLLRHHILINSCSNVEVVEAVIGRTEQDVSFAYCPDPTDPIAFANSIAYKIQGKEAVVRMRTLDEICQKCSPELIKIDIEGAELLALQGAGRVLGVHRPVVIVAIHPDPLRMLGMTPRQVIEFMTDQDYVGTTVEGRRVDNPGFEEVIFFPRT
jgi:FkbM family methyltransferase